MALGKWASSRAWPLREEGSWRVYKLAIGMAGGLDLLVPPFAQFKAKFSYLIFSLFCRLSKCINHTGLKAGWRVEFCAVNWKQHSRTKLASCFTWSLSLLACMIIGGPISFLKLVSLWSLSYLVFFIKGINIQ